MAETIDVREAISSPLTPDIAISPKSSVSHRTDDLSDQEDGEERSECNPVFYHHHNAHHLGREDQAVIENKEDKYFDASHQDPTLLSAAATPFVPGNASGGSSHARVAPPHNLQNRIVGGSHMINPTVAPTMAPAGNTFPFPIASIAVPSPQQLGHNMHQKMGVQPHTMVIPHPQVMILQGQDRTSNTIPFQFPVQFQPGGPIHISNGIQSPQMVAVPQPHASFPIVNPSILNSPQIPINLQQQILIQQQLALQKQYTMNQFNQNVFTASANSSSPRPVPAPSEAIRNQSMQQKQNTSTQGMNTNHASDSGTNSSLPVSTTNVPTQNSSKAETSTQNTSNHSGNTPTVILLLGVCGSGKTTLGRKLAVEHNYLFFSGGETLREHAYDSDMSKEWVRRRIATDALGQNLDALMHQSCKQKGIVIDRQGKSVEDMFYLNRILRSRKLQINAILVFETSDDEVLKLRIKERNLKESSRNEGTDEHVINERIRATRSVMERCVELFLQGQSNVLVARIDAGRDENIVMADMCASLASILSPAIQARAHNFSLPVLSENPNLVFVEDVVEYCNVIDRLMILLRQDRSTKFPGTSVSCYVNRHWLEAIGRHKHDAYKLTRKYHGPRFLYMRLKNEKCAYMIPRHMRCVFSIPEDIHESLSSGLILQSFADLDGDMILDGELLRVRRRADGNIIAHQENLMVSDVLVYNGKPVLRYSWDERQAILASLLHCESSLQSMQNRERLDDAVACPAPIKFFRKRFYDVCDIAEVIKVGDYPSDGIIFQHKREYKSGRDEKLLRWKPPSAITCDFRVANVERLSGSSVKRVYLEVLINDKRTRYVPLGNHLFVDLEPDSYRRTDVHFGVIIECSILDPVDPRNMKLRFVRVCTDKTVANYKQQIDELLSPAFHITAPKLIECLTGVSETSQIPSRNFRARDESNKHHGWDQSQLANTDLFRAEWGSAYVPDNNEKESGFASNGHRMPKQTNSYSRGSGEHSSNDKEKWSSLRRGSNDVHGSSNQSASQREASSNRMRKPDKGFFNDGLTKSREDSGKRGDQTKRSSRDLRSAHQNSRCHGCHALTSKTVDDCNGHFYCYPCWSELGYGDCFSCGEFLKVQEYQYMFLCHACRPYYGCCAECHANGEEGERDKNDDRFYCYNCWDKYDDGLKQLRGGNKNRRAKSRTATQSDTGRNPLKTSKRRAKNTDDNRAQQPKQGEVRQVNAEKKIVASESEMVKKDSNSSSENQRSDTQKCTSEQITTKIEQTSTEEVK